MHLKKFFYFLVEKAKKCTFPQTMDGLRYDIANPSNRLRPAWITPAVIEYTRTVFQPDYPDEDLTDETIIDLLQNVGGLFEVLFPERKDHASKNKDREVEDGV